MEKQREAEAAALWPEANLREDFADNYPYPYPAYPASPNEQDLEADLQGEVIVVTLTKTTQGFGFTIIGGDRPGELLQIKNIVEDSVAHHDGRLDLGDVLVRINGISVLTYSHRKVVELFQSLRLGSNVEIEVRRGYPLPNMRPNDDFQSASGAAGGGGGAGRGQGYQGGYGEPPPPGQMPVGGSFSEQVTVQIIKGPLGFGFSLGELGEWQGVESIAKHFVKAEAQCMYTQCK